MAKTYVTILGVVFIVIGILGFVSPVAPDDKLLDIFAVSTSHNLVHLLSGVVALVAAGSGEAYASLYAKVFGVVYALVTILGFIVGEGTVLFFPVNQADNVLHMVIAATTLYVGFSTPAPAGPGRRTESDAAA